MNTYDLKIKRFGRSEKRFNRKRIRGKIPATVLEKEIGKRFGISSYVITNIKQNLAKWNIMKPIDPFWWRIVKEGDGEETKKTA